jgi:putative endonuclease
MDFQHKGRFWVYVAECKDRTYYTGSTNNLEKRIKLDNSENGARYLLGKPSVRLVYAKEYKYYNASSTK